MRPVNPASLINPAARVYMSLPLNVATEFEIRAIDKNIKTLHDFGYAVYCPGLPRLRESDDKNTLMSNDKNAMAKRAKLLLTCDALVLPERIARSKEQLAEIQLARLFELPVFRLKQGWPTYMPHDLAIVGISGFAGSGKDSLGAFLVARGFKKIAFADKVKQLAVALCPSLGERIAAGETLDDLKRSDPSVRRWLQDVGLTARDVMGDDVWIRSALEGLSPDEQYVITDVRFSNEVEAIREKGGILVRMERPGVGPANNHPSETELADYQEWDIVVNNDGALDDLGEVANVIADNLMNGD